MTTPTPMIDLMFDDDEKLLGAARELYQKYDVTELDACNITQLARLSGRQQTLNILEQAVMGLRERPNPLP